MNTPRYPRVNEEDFSVPSLEQVILNRPDPPRRWAPVLLPNSILQPWVLALIWIVPQCVLLAINLQAWDLASGEVNADERRAALIIFAAEMVTLGLGVGICAWLWLGKQTFHRALGWFPLAIGSFFLATALLIGEHAIPNTVADWMLSSEQWILKQFALVMPAALFGALRVLCPDREGNEHYAERFFLSFAAAAGLVFLCVPFLFVAMGLASVFSQIFPGPFEIVVAAAYLVLSIVAAAAVLRVSLSAYVWSRANSPHSLFVLTASVALLAPLGGLLLNLVIPFPANFQTPGVYVATVLNAVLLLLPNFAHPRLHRAVWLAQCVMFPFSIYFFAVFLPFLPLTPLAALYMGLGLLMYAPSLLFLLHGYRILDGFRAEIRDGGRLAPAALGLAALLAWPVAYTVQARWDRANLNGALDYLQYPDYARNQRFPGNLGALHSSLVHLRDFKEGIYLPYLSEYYNWLAFDGMTLPQEKLNGLATTFFGAPLPAAQTPRMDLFERRNPRRTVTEILNGENGARPTTDAVIRSIQTSRTVAQGLVRTSAVLTVANPNIGTTEFQTLITVPPGAMISNMWLTIGTERVPGKIFEKRAALWVYQKITEAQPVARDPAILRYVGPNLAELRVYPVTNSEPRIVEVEFLSPDGSAGTARIGKENVALDSPAPPSATVGVAGDGRMAVFIPEEEAAKFPGVIREPYLHFLVDASKDSAFADPEVLRKALRTAATQFPDVRDARVTFVNFETQDLAGGKLMTLAELLALPADKLLASQFRGGFLGYRAMKQSLWQHHLALAETSEAREWFPKFVLLSPPGSKPNDDAGNLAEFARLSPENPSYCTVSGDSPANLMQFDPQTSGFTRGGIRIFRVGGQVFAAPIPGSMSYVGINPAAPSREITALDPATGKFVAAIGQPADIPAYARAAAPWSVELGRIFEPSAHRKDALDALLKLCRETGVLVPSAAYMVVENTAQWKMIERTEKKTMKGHEAMEVTETSTPEPGTTMLVLIGLAALYFTRQTRRRPRRA